MLKAFSLFIACLIVVRMQFALLGDVLVLDPIFLAGFYTALAVPAPACLWLAMFMGLAGDWMTGYPLGLQGLALVGVAYLASQAHKHILMTSWIHFGLLAAGLFMFQQLIIHGTNLLLRLRMLTAVHPMDIVTGGLTCCVGAAMAYAHEKRSRL
jgi:rod shape-determining protein MreD